MLWAKIRKNITISHLKLIFFTAVKLHYISWACVRNVDKAIRKLKLTFANFGTYNKKFEITAHNNTIEAQNNIDL